MTAHSLSRFLEEYGASEPADAPSPESFPGFLSLDDGASLPPSVSTGKLSMAAREDELQAARMTGFEEGHKQATDDLEARHVQAIEALRLDLAQSSDQIRKAENAALTEAIGALFRQYDDWIDSLISERLRPVLQRAMHAEALDQFRAKILRAASRTDSPVILSGPGALIARMETILAGSGLTVQTEPDDNRELTATLDRETLQTRIGSIDDLLAGEPPDEGNEDAR